MADAFLMNHSRKKEGLKYFDTFTNIGAKETLKGATYNEAGYFGIVPASQLFTGSELALAVGISAGTAQHNNVDWLKFYLDGKILFRPMKSIRNSISWDSINAMGCVNGTKTVAKNGVTFKVRLMRGSNVTPAIATNNTTNTMKYSEWNRLMLPIHTQSATKVWAYPNYVEEDIPNWDIGFTDTELLTHNSAGAGSYVWCQEKNSTLRPVVRGYNGISFGSTIPPETATAIVGWSPVLEVVEGGM